MDPSTTTTDASAIGTLLQSWEKGLRTLSMYLPNNPVRQQTIEALQEEISGIWQDLPDLRLAVWETGLEWESEIVLPVGEKAESLAWTLFQDGIRWIAFTPGVEEEEIFTFLGFVQRARTLTDEDEDDLRTLLWSVDFQFIRYKVAELEQGGEEAMEDIVATDLAPRPTAEEVRDAIREDTADEDVDGQEDTPTPNAPVNLEEFDSTLYFLEKAEIDYLKAEVRREYEQHLSKKVLSMLFNIFEQEPAEDTRGEIISVLQDLIPYLLNSGDFRSVAYVMSETHVVFSRVEMLKHHRQLLAALTMTFSSPEAVEQLLEALNVAMIEPLTDEIDELFAYLRPAVLSTLLKWYGRLSNDELRLILKRAMNRIAEARPDVLGAALESSERVLVVKALELVEESGLEGVGDQLVGLIGSDDVPIRNVLVRALGAVPTAQTMRALVTLMKDTDSEVRTAAARTVAAKRFKGALPALEEAVLGKGLRSRDLTERKAFFEAYGIIAGDPGVSKLEGILLRNGFWRPEDSDTRACAAMALGNVDSQSARIALQRATKDKDPVVRSAAMRALRGDPV